MKTLRQTILNAYETCPLMCMLDWGEYGTPDRGNREGHSNKYASTGIALHEVMEYWGNKKINHEEVSHLELHDLLDTKFRELPDELFENSDDRTKFYNSLHEQLSWLYEQNHDTTPLQCEMEFKIEDMFDNMPPITGTIDRIDGNLETREVDIVDYKSGKVFTKRELQSNIQATLYSLAFFRKYKFFPKRFIFLFSKHKKVKTIFITPEFLKAGTERIMSIWLHIKNNDFNALENPNKYFCRNFCEHVKECPKMKKKQGWENVGFQIHESYLNV